MAKNWTVAEATEEILSGNKEAVIDIGRRFPLAARAIAVAGESAKEILSAFNFVTIRKVESILKDGVEVSNEDDDIEDPTEKPAKAAKEEKKPAKKEEKPAKKEAKPKKGMNKPEAADDEEDYESMSEVELFKVCKAKGLKPAPKQKKQYYLDLLNPSEEEAWDDEEDEKPAKKPAKKGKKTVEDEDDDWDI